MSDEERNDNRSLLDKLIALLSGLPWLEVLQGLWKAIRKLIQARSYRGMYEVLDYESTLELKGRGGKHGSITDPTCSEMRWVSCCSGWRIY